MKSAFQTESSDPTQESSSSTDIHNHIPSQSEFVDLIIEFSENQNHLVKKAKNRECKFYSTL